MKRTFYFFSLLLITGFASGQAHDHSKCATDAVYQQQMHADPGVSERAAQFEADVEKMIAQYDQTHGKAPEKFIIPMVFHIFHTGGNENISMAQIRNQIDTLNRAFNGPKFERLREIYWGVAADCEIEFRLATIDPNGKCTNGVVRVYDPETANGTNNIKLKSAWPTDKYLNVWVVREINIATGFQNGVVLGYAQFPWAGTSQFDGIVMRSDNIGSIGTGAASGQWGSTLVHEVGHWLGLYHTFQDSCGGGDQVDDTPPVAVANFNCDYGMNSCHNDAPDMPDMVENYMDYAPGSCMATYTIGQKIRMHTTLKNWRPKLWLPSNLVATGTADPYTFPSCAPRAHFYTATPHTCVSGSVQFFEDAYNYTGSVTYSWEFPGGTTANPTVANPVVTYNEPGIYDVTLIVSNTLGSDTFTRKAFVTVFKENGDFGAGLTEGFEFEVFPVNGWSTYSTSAVKFQRVGTGAGSMGEGNFAAYVANNQLEEGARFYLESPTVDFSMVNNPVVSFDYAFARRRLSNGAGSNDNMVVQTSTDCGRTWTTRRTIASAELSTIGTTTPFTNVFFFPSGPDQWKTISVDLSMLSPAQRKNVKIRFEFRSFGGHNLFIDNINLGFNTGVTDILNSPENFNVYPNPSSGQTQVKVFIPEAANGKLEVLDMYGRTVAVLAEGALNSGEQEFQFIPSTALSNGMYVVRLIVNGQSFTRKLMLIQ